MKERLCPKTAVLAMVSGPDVLFNVQIKQVCFKRVLLTEYLQDIGFIKLDIDMALECQDRRLKQYLQFVKNYR